MKELQSIAKKIDKYRRDFDLSFNYEQHKASHEIWKEVVLLDDPEAFKPPFDAMSFNKKYKHNKSF